MWAWAWACDDYFNWKYHGTDFENYLTSGVTLNGSKYCLLDVLLALLPSMFARGVFGACINTGAIF